MEHVRAVASSRDPHNSIEDGLLVSQGRHVAASLKAQKSLRGCFGTYYFSHPGQEKWFNARFYNDKMNFVLHMSILTIWLLFSAFDSRSCSRQACKPSNVGPVLLLWMARIVIHQR